jgi:hypothetical protein
MTPKQRHWFARSCALSVLGGALLGTASRQTGQPAPLSSSIRQAAPEKRPESVRDDVKFDRALLLRRTLAQGETEDLWKWLENPGTEDENTLLAVIFELVERQGWQAWRQVLAIPDPALREKLGKHFLWVFSDRDPWKAYEEWKLHRDGFEDPEWGAAAYDAALRAAAGMSSDKLLEVLAEVPTKADEGPHSLLTPDYGSGFDFEAVLDHLLAAPEQPVLVTDGLLREWSRRSPADAAIWLLENPRATESEYLLDEALSSFGSVLADGLDEISRDRTLDALEALERQSPEFLDGVWDAAIDAAAGKLSESALAAADRMARRNTYLVGSLLETRYHEEIDPSWRLLPPEERQRVLRLAEQRWAAEQPSVVQARARERWLRRVTAAWEDGSRAAETGQSRPTSE